MEILIETNREQYHPGELVTARVRLKSVVPVKARGLQAVLYCHEKVKKKGYTTIPPDEVKRMRELGVEVTSTVKHTETYSESDTFKEERKLAPEGEFRDQEYQFSFKLPVDGRPTSHEMGHDDRTTIWMLKVKIDIPFAPDFNSEKEIFVVRL